MTYTRPYVIAGPALSAVQSNAKGSEQDPDANPPHNLDATLSAYEADE